MHRYKEETKYSKQIFEASFGANLRQNLADTRQYRILSSPVPVVSGSDLSKKPGSILS